MDCREMGYTEGSFASRAWQEHELTKYYRVKARDVLLWEYSGETAEGAVSVFCFKRPAGCGEGRQPGHFAIKMDASLMEGAVSCACLRSAFSGGLFASGICPEDRERMFVFTAQGLRSFSDTLRAYGKSIKKTPVEAGAFAAGEFAAAGQDREWVFCVKDGGGPVGFITGACRGRYAGSGFLGVHAAYCAIKSEFDKRGFGLSFRKWEISNGVVRVYAQCPALLDVWILLADADSGRQAFSMQAVSGDPFSNKCDVISRHSLRHTSSMPPARFCMERMPDLASDVMSWLRGRRSTAAA